MHATYDYAKDSNYSNLKDLEIPGKLALTGTRASKVLNQQLVTMELCTPCAEECSLQQSFASGWRLGHTINHYQPHALFFFFHCHLCLQSHCCLSFTVVLLFLSCLLFWMFHQFFLCTLSILTMDTCLLHHHHHREPHTYKYSIYLPEPNHLFAIALVMAVNSVAFPVIDINLLHST